MTRHSERSRDVRPKKGHRAGVERGKPDPVTSAGHTADLKRLPASMKVSCYFAEQIPLSNSPLAEQINQVITKELKEIGVVISAKAILFFKD